MIAARVNSMTQAAQSLITSPLVKVLSLGFGVQKALGISPAGRNRIEPTGENDRE